MASYDSDSSGAEDKDFTETEVLLGYVSKEANGETISRLGGRPEWLEPGKAPSAALAKCKVCNDLMVLLLQLNGELPERFPGQERRLYVFSCRHRTCRRKEGSVRALRGVRVSPEAAAATAAKKQSQQGEVRNKITQPRGGDFGKIRGGMAQALGLGETLFGVKSTTSTSGSTTPFSSSSAGSKANPFSSNSGGAGGSNPFGLGSIGSTPKIDEPTSKDKEKEGNEEGNDAAADLPKTFAETLSLNNPQAATQGPPPPPEPWPEESAQPAPFPTYWISDAEYETLDPTPMPRVSTTTTTAAMMDIDEGVGASGGGKEDKEVFESTMDSTFQRFADRIGQNPDQVIRYEYAGQPLLYSKADAVGRALSDDRPMPRCQNCGAGRLFEVQLTPHAITELESEEDGLEGMDWGTVIVGVCDCNCQQRSAGPGEAGYLEEWVGVQWEELTARR